MPYSQDIFQQDLRAVKDALEKEDFDNLNIFANRITGNSYIFADKPRMICGLILKDMALTLLPLAQSKKSKSVTTAKALAAGFFKKLSDHAKGEINTLYLWEEYHSFSNSVKRNLMDEHEDVSYKGEDSAFTHEGVMFLLKLLKTRKDALHQPECLLFKGILNEISRLYKVHGGELSDEFAFFLITALDRCHEYVLEIFGHDETILGKEVDGKIGPEVDNVLEIMNKVEESKGKWIPEVDEELFKLGSMWREYFILYMEHGKQAKEMAVRLPAESRKKLTEAIARSLEEELPKKTK